MPVLQPNTLREMTDLEVQWVAGLLEGEGAFTWAGRKWSPRVACRMTDQDVVRRLHEVTGVGAVYAEKRGGNRKPTWVWVCQARLNTLALIRTLWPHMGERRRQQMATVWLDATLRR